MKYYIHIKSITVYVPSSELGLSHPLSRQRVCPPPPPEQRVGGGHSWGLVNGPHSNDWRKSLALFLLWVCSCFLERVLPSCMFSVQRNVDQNSLASYCTLILLILWLTFIWGLERLCYLASSLLSSALFAASSTETNLYKNCNQASWHRFYLWPTDTPFNIYAI